jgi:AbrB family looped-hinge helix DNA binding protein
MLPMKSVVSEKGQVTIPKRLRERLGIRPGTVIEFEEASGRLVGRKARVADPLDELFGSVSLGVDTDAYLEELRGPGPDR